MAQFDTLIIFPVIFSLLLVLFFHYYINIKITIPNFFEVKKFRKKSLNPSFFHLFFNDNTLLNLKNSYKQNIPF